MPEADSSPVWRQPAFIDVYGRPLHAKHFADEISSLQNESDLPDLSWSTSLMRSGLGWMGMGKDDEGGLSELKSALQLICTLLDTSAPPDSDDKEALRAVGSVLLTAFETASALPVSSGDSAKFLEFLTSTLLPALAALPPSGIACVPCGWSTREGTNAMMLVINRRRETCDVFVCNAGQGTEYHPTRADVRTGGVQMQLPLRLGDVPIEKVCDPTFWFLVLRPIIWPAGKADLPHKTLYEQLLPYLN
ncbi:MAG: hypothetical protein SGPRY_005989, partial [Prymnesium sp.]